MVNYEKITELFQQEAFKTDAAECKTMEDFYNLFVKNGVEITEEETVELISQIAEKKKQADAGEFSESELDSVAGGVILTGAAAVAACIGAGVVTVGAFALSAYVGYQSLRWTYKGKK